MVGLAPLFAVETLSSDVIDALPGCKRRLQWFLENRPERGENVETATGEDSVVRRFLSLVNRDRLRSVLRYMLDESEFLSPHGVRALSRVHREHPFVLHVDGREYRVDYEPAESSSGLFGGNSNWRGPVWFPLNYLLIEALQRYHYAYGDSFQVECPTGSGNLMDLQSVSEYLRARLASLFLPGETGCRPCHGSSRSITQDPHWRDLILFHEYFHGDDGRGLGASHQTGWTALIAPAIESLARSRAKRQNAGAALPSSAPAKKKPRSRRA
jgi:hypothetical protein